jgi:hypothetical protein
MAKETVLIQTTSRQGGHKFSIANLDDSVKSQNLDGFVKCSRSRHANPEE